MCNGLRIDHWTVCSRSSVPLLDTNVSHRGEHPGELSTIFLYQGLIAAVHVSLKCRILATIAPWMRPRGRRRQHHEW